MSVAAPVRVFTKDPTAVTDYYFDWSDWLGPHDTISTSTWAASTGLTVDSQTKAASLTTVWVSGGTAGTAYELSNTIATAQGRTEKRTVSIVVVDR